MRNYNAPRYSSSRATASRFCRAPNQPPATASGLARSLGTLPHHRGDAPARELRLEFRQREESHAGKRTRLRDAALRELAREQNGGHAGNLGAVLRFGRQDRKSTRLNSSHSQISYAVFCLKKKKTRTHLGTLCPVAHSDPTVSQRGPPP